jgi:AcrR family transcriptional regulator
VVSNAGYVGRRERILAAAVAHFSAKPYEDVSVDDVCQSVGVAHGLVSYHFGGKRALFAAAVESVSEGMLEYERPRENEATLSAKLRGSLRRRFEYARKHPNRVTLLLNSHSRDPEIEKFLNSLRAHRMLQWTDMVGCADHIDASPKLRTSLRGWMGWVDSVLLDEKESADVEIEYLVDSCVQVLVTAVRIANGYQHDKDAELAALEMVMKRPDAADPGALADFEPNGAVAAAVGQG